MKKIVLSVLLLFIVFSIKIQAQTPEEMPYANPITVQLARSLSKDIFEMNGIPFMQPLVEVLNATSNSRFYNDAYIPKKVEKPYFRLSLNGMMGMVPSNMKKYKPNFPNEPFSAGRILGDTMISIGTGGVVTKLDTGKLISYLFRTIIYDGMNLPESNSDKILVPNEAATILGYQQAAIVFPGGSLQRIGQRRIDTVNMLLTALKAPKLSDSLTNTILNALGAFPGNFTFPTGSNMNSLAAGVPQLEIGSYFGTELLIRFIPKVNLGKDIGNFSFYGLGIKHSISQYFEDPTFNLAFQIAYQTSSLDNTIGLTNAKLKSDANFFNVNVHASKSIKNYFDIFSGLSYETVNIKSTYTYLLPVEMQVPLKLLDTNKSVSPGYPGDKQAQVSLLELKSTNLKWVIGISKKIGNFALYADYSLSNFNIFTFGTSYTFGLVPNKENDLVD